MPTKFCYMFLPRIPAKPIFFPILYLMRYAGFNFCLLWISAWHISLSDNFESELTLDTLISFKFIVTWSIISLIYEEILKTKKGLPKKPYWKFNQYMQKKHLTKSNTHILIKLGIEGNFLNMIKSIYQKPTANILLNGEKIDGFSPKVRNKARMCSLITPIQCHTGRPS